MDSSNNKTKKSIKNIVLTLILILMLFSTKSLAYNWFDLANLIAHINSSTPGQAPWYTTQAERYVVYPSPVHYQAFQNDEVQEATIMSKAVYCCDLYSEVRSGKFKDDVYYLADDVTGYTPSGVLALAKSKFENYEGLNYQMNRTASTTYEYSASEAFEAANGRRKVTNISDAYFSSDAVFNESGYGFVFKDGPEFFSCQDEMNNKMQEVFRTIAKEEKVDFYNEAKDVSWPDAPTFEEINDANGVIGPIIAIMEKEKLDEYDKANEGYKEADSGVYSNNAEAYVLTAIGGLYNEGRREYSYYAIQNAWWQLVDTGIEGHQLGTDPNSDVESGNAIKNEALAYEAYRDTYLGEDGKLKKDQFGIDKSKAEAIIDQEAQSYTVGPFTLYYPSSVTVGGTAYSLDKIIYVKGLTINTFDNKNSTEVSHTLRYDEMNNDFEIIYPRDSYGTVGGSGLTKLYPRSNNSFYVRFYSNGGNGFAACGTPEKVDVSFSLEYLTTTDADYQMLVSNANLYAFIGHMDWDPEFTGQENNRGKDGDSYNTKAPLSGVMVDVTYVDAVWVNSGYYQYAAGETMYYTAYEFVAAYPDEITDATDISQYWHSTSHYAWDTANPTTKSYFPEMWYFQPYIQMSTSRYNWYVLPQKLMYTDKGHRKYITILSSASVDLTMELGGRVYEDLRRGKKSEVDGYNAITTITSGEPQDYPMENVIVLLYKHPLGNSLGENEEGQFAGWTKTDANGEYLFKDINEMYKYHVEFIYNGQYYEPTKYTMYESYNESTEKVKEELKAQNITDENVLKNYTRKSRWEKSSKALESYAERDEFNKKFEEVGAYPTNVVPDSNGNLQYPTTYREDLENQKVIDHIINEENKLRKSAGILLNYSIDDNGKLVVTNNSSEYIDYARESLMKAYTYEKYDDANKKLDLFLYPISEVFVDNDKVLSSHTDVMQKSIKALYEVLDNESIDEMHHINLGLVDREEMQLKLEKDVAAIYFEVNGKTHVYNYHTRHVGDNKVGYGLDVRAIDGFARYREDLTREIYREDYEYDGSLYKNNLKTINPETGKKEDMSPEDYIAFCKAKETGELEIYVKYKIVVTLKSSLIKTRVTEIVDYYDKEFTPIGNTVTGTGTKEERVRANIITQEEVDKYAPYYGKLNTSDKIVDLKDQYAGLSENKIEVSDTSKYKDDKNAKGKGDPEDAFLNDYNRLYLNTENVYLDPVNANFIAYVTYRVNKQEVGGKRKYVILDEAGAMNAEDAAYIMASKVNMAEINGYKTYYYDETKAPNYNNEKDNYAKGEYKEDDVAGIVDRWSTPGNLEYVSKDNVIDVKDDAGTTHKVLAQAEKVAKEPDADMAPLLHIILNRAEARTIVGNVWEDERIDDGETSHGNGTRDGNDKDVNGVIVQLVELQKDNEGKTIESIRKQYKTGKTKDGAITSILNTGESDDKIQTDEGQYTFIGIPAGDYVVRFIYGADASTAIGTEGTNYTTGEVSENSNPVFALVNDGEVNLENEILQSSTIYDQSGANGNKNLHSYTGNDYKSTTYEAHIGDIALDATETGTYRFDFGALDNAEGTYSYAKDIWSRRESVNKYSNSEEGITNHRAEVLSAYESIPNEYGPASMNSLLGELYAYTYMVAETGLIDFEVEYNRPETEYSGNGVGEANYDKSGFYKVLGLDFGLERRPKAQLKTTNQVINVKVTLANGNVLFDARDTATNVQWTKHLAHNPDINNEYTDSINYNGNKMNIPSVRSAGSNGVINLTMDEELMQGALIEITYAITVANIGEVDYKTKAYYYKGIKGAVEDIVTTTPNDVLVYVGYQPGTEGRKNNLLFNADENPQWETIKDNTSNNIYKTSNATLSNRTDEYYDIVTYSFVNSNGEEISKFATALGMEETAVDDNLANYNLKDSMNKYNVIIHTKNNSLARKLIPIKADTKAQDIDDMFANDPMHAIEYINSKVKSVSGVPLKLSTVISGDTKGADMIYNNLVELAKVSNEVGRRMNYSVVGNEDPAPENVAYAVTEIDADISQEVSILPPFGQSQRYYYLGFGVAAILMVGTLMVMAFTKKKDDGDGKATVTIDNK